MSLFGALYKYLGVKIENVTGKHSKGKSEFRHARRPVSVGLPHNDLVKSGYDRPRSAAGGNHPSLLPSHHERKYGFRLPQHIKYLIRARKRLNETRNDQISSPDQDNQLLRNLRDGLLEHQTTDNLVERWQANEFVHYLGSLSSVLPMRAESMNKEMALVSKKNDQLRRRKSAQGRAQSMTAMLPMRYRRRREQLIQKALEVMEPYRKSKPGDSMDSTDSVASSEPIAETPDHSTQSMNQYKLRGDLSVSSNGEFFPNPIKSHRPQSPHYHSLHEDKRLTDSSDSDSQYSFTLKDDVPRSTALVRRHSRKCTSNQPQSESPSSFGQWQIPENPILGILKGANKHRSTDNRLSSVPSPVHAEIFGDHEVRRKAYFSVSPSVISVKSNPSDYSEESTRRGAIKRDSIYTDNQSLHSGNDAPVRVNFQDSGQSKYHDSYEPRLRLECTKHPPTRPCLSPSQLKQTPSHTRRSAGSSRLSNSTSTSRTNSRRLATHESFRDQLPRQNLLPKHLRVTSRTSNYTGGRRMTSPNPISSSFENRKYEHIHRMGQQTRSLYRHTRDSPSSHSVATSAPFDYLMNGRRNASISDIVSQQYPLKTHFDSHYPRTICSTIRSSRIAVADGRKQYDSVYGHQRCGGFHKPNTFYTRRVGIPQIYLPNNEPCHLSFALTGKLCQSESESTGSTLTHPCPVSSPTIKLSRSRPWQDTAGSETRSTRSVSVKEAMGEPVIPDSSNNNTQLMQRGTGIGLYSGDKQQQKLGSFQHSAKKSRLTWLLNWWRKSNTASLQGMHSNNVRQETTLTNERQFNLMKMEDLESFTLTPSSLSHQCEGKARPEDETSDTFILSVASEFLHSTSDERFAFKNRPRPGIATGRKKTAAVPPVPERKSTPVEDFQPDYEEEKEEYEDEQEVGQASKTLREEAISEEKMFEELAEASRHDRPQEFPGNLHECTVSVKSEAVEEKPTTADTIRTVSSMESLHYDVEPVRRPKRRTKRLKRKTLKSIRRRPNSSGRQTVGKRRSQLSSAAIEGPWIWERDNTSTETSLERLNRNLKGGSGTKLRLIRRVSSDAVRLRRRRRRRKGHPLNSPSKKGKAKKSGRSFRSAVRNLIRRRRWLRKRRRLRQRQQQNRNMHETKSPGVFRQSAYSIIKPFNARWSDHHASIMRPPRFSGRYSAEAKHTTAKDLPDHSNRVRQSSRMCMSDSPFVAVQRRRKSKALRSPSDVRSEGRMPRREKTGRRKPSTSCRKFKKAKESVHYDFGKLSKNKRIYGSQLANSMRKYTKNRKASQRRRIRSTKRRIKAVPIYDTNISYGQQSVDESQLIDFVVYVSVIPSEIDELVLPFRACNRHHKITGDIQSLITGLTWGLDSQTSFGSNRDGPFGDGQNGQQTNNTVGTDSKRAGAEAGRTDGYPGGPARTYPTPLLARRQVSSVDNKRSVFKNLLSGLFRRRRRTPHVLADNQHALNLPDVQNSFAASGDQSEYNNSLYRQTKPAVANPSINSQNSLALPNLNMKEVAFWQQILRRCKDPRLSDLLTDLEEVSDRRVLAIERSTYCRIKLNEGTIHLVHGLPCMQMTFLANDVTSIQKAIGQLQTMLPKLYKQIVFSERFQRKHALGLGYAIPTTEKFLIPATDNTDNYQSSYSTICRFIPVIERALQRIRPKKREQVDMSA